MTELMVQLLIIRLSTLYMHSKTQEIGVFVRATDGREKIKTWQHDMKQIIMQHFPKGFWSDDAQTNTDWEDLLNDKGPNKKAIICCLAEE